MHLTSMTDGLLYAMQRYKACLRAVVAFYSHPTLVHGSVSQAMWHLLNMLSTVCCGAAANLNKVPHGGWFALAIAGGVFSVSFLWWWGTHTKLKGILASQVLLPSSLTEPSC